MMAPAVIPEKTKRCVATKTSRVGIVRIVASVRASYLVAMMVFSANRAPTASGYMLFDWVSR